MIVRSKPTVKDILLTVNSSMLPKIAGLLATIALVCVVAILAVEHHPGIFARINAIPFTLIGIALSVFMSFRNNTCYARWWEARKLWGDLIIACRCFARQAASLPENDRRYMLQHICGFTAGLTARLRRTDELAAIRRWCDLRDAAHGPNPTDAVLHQLGQYCLQLMHERKIEPIHYSVLETQLNALSHTQGGCERILFTPVPFSYSLLLHRTAMIFCFTLPFALAGSLGWWTLLPVLLIAYTFFGLDALGHQLEDPFGPTPNALPLLAMRRTIEREMLSLLGHKRLPRPLTAYKGVLR